MIEDENSPELTIVIPVYNEEGILREAVTALVGELAELDWSYELILAENGSRDNTVSLGKTLEEEFEQVTMLSVNEPNYGLALRTGIERARGKYVICDEIDLCDIDFYKRAMDLLRSSGTEMVVGSKVMKGSHDQRPVMRRVATRVINGMLRVAVGFKGTDTHGLKAFEREPLMPIVDQCVVDKNLFASEFVIRAGRANKRVVEIPIRLEEKRRPATSLVSRVPGVLANLARLTIVIRTKND